MGLRFLLAAAAPGTSSMLRPTLGLSLCMTVSVPGPAPPSCRLAWLLSMAWLLTRLFSVTCPATSRATWPPHVCTTLAWAHTPYRSITANTPLGTPSIATPWSCPLTV